LITFDNTVFGAGGVPTFRTSHAKTIANLY
jgi:hypothetical protein